MLDPNAQPTSVNSTHCVPPLSIRHILLWTALSAVLFAVTGAEHWWVEAGNETLVRSIAYRTWETIFSVLTAAAVTGTFVLVMNRDLEGRIFRASGHWLLMGFGVSTLSHLLFRAMFGTVISNRWLWVACLPMLATAVAYIVPAYVNRGKWRWIFSAYAGTQVLVLGQHLLSFGFHVQLPYIFQVNQFVQPAILLVAIVVAIQEYLAGTTRDWLHCLGTGLTFTLLASIAFWYLIPLFVSF